MDDVKFRNLLDPKTLSALPDRELVQAREYAEGVIAFNSANELKAGLSIASLFVGPGLLGKLLGATAKGLASSSLKRDAIDGLADSIDGFEKGVDLAQRTAKITDEEANSIIKEATHLLDMRAEMPGYFGATPDGRVKQFDGRPENDHHPGLTVKQYLKLDAVLRSTGWYEKTPEERAGSVKAAIEQKPSGKQDAGDPGGIGLGPGAQYGANSFLDKGGRSDRDQQGGGRPSSASDGDGSGRAGSGGGASDSGRVNGGPATTGGAGRPGSEGGDARREGSSSSSSPGRADRDQQGSRAVDRTATEGRRPVLLDLDGNGVKITEFDKSSQFVTGKDGLQHRTSWASAGDGVLFYDPDGRNTITEERQYVFTEWNPTAAGDLEALRSIWDTNGDGKLSAADAEFAKFKVLVTNADGSTTVMTLTQLGITEINLTANTVNIELPDGSVITGQTTFARANGTTGTVANTTLTADAAGYRVVEVVAADASGNRVVTQTGYAADGGVAFKIVTTTNPSGNQVLRLYDDNGDGVVDRVQRIDTVTLGNGSKVETVLNRVGADPATAILADRTVTTTSADGTVITIERDSVGGGWFDQREVWTTHADGSRTELLQELAQNGSVIHGRSETVSANGLVRSEGTDRDGNGVAETVESHSIVIAANNSRTEVTEIRNGDGTLRAGKTEAVSADGKVRTVTSDLDGNGTVDRTDAMAISGSAGMATTSVATVRNGDGSTRSVMTVVQSADALTKTTSADVDGDGDVDLTTVDQTMIAADGARVRTVTATNTDGSVRGLMRETLGADKVTAQTWVDQNQDGIFQATDLTQQVTVGAGQARTETTWARNPDGSLKAVSVAVTSADGLVTNSTVDADGDGDTDMSVSDITTVSGGVATRTVQVVNQDGGLRSREVTVTSANGLTVSRTVDVDANGTLDAQTVDARVLNGDGSVTRTVSEFAGDGTTLTGRTVRVESADRRTVTVTTDANGDGATDRVVSSLEAADGSTTVTATSFSPGGAVVARTVTVTSANGLVTTTSADANGDLANETVVTDTTALNLNGARVQTVDVNNADGSNRTLTVMTVSDDGLVVTTQADMNGDNAFDRTTSTTKVLNANGSVTETVQSRAQNAALLNQVQTTVSDDGLVATFRSDADGDGDFDLLTTQTTTLLNDGGRSEVFELRSDTNVLRIRTTTTSTDDARSITRSTDANGDGVNDAVWTRTIANTGVTTEQSARYSTTGALQSLTRTVTSDDGLSITESWDRDGDGTQERRSIRDTVLNANGSITTTTTGRGANDEVYTRSSTTVSDDRLTTSRADDVDGDGTTEYTQTQTRTMAVNGVFTDTIQTTSENNSLLNRTIIVTSADERTVTQSVDLDGNGVNDRQTVTALANSGATTSTTTYLSTGGAVEGRFSRTTSADGLVTTTVHDTNGDGRTDLSSTDQAVLSANGEVSRSITYTNERNQIVGQEQSIVSDDANRSTVLLDLNGDDVFEFRTETTRTYAADGDVVQRQATKDATLDTISEVTTTTSGNGLRTTVVTDFNGDGNADRNQSLTKAADGSWVETNTLFYPGTRVTETTIRSQSADGRTLTTTRDLNGDGQTDRSIVAVTDLSSNQQIDYKDVRLDGTRGTLITEKVSANGMDRSFTFDVDNDNKSDFARFTDVTFNADGSTTETFREIYEANVAIYGTYGAKKMVYSEVRTQSANGLQASTEIDADGDGQVDATTTEVTNIGIDGRQTITAETRYADGDLRSLFVTEVSSDGRHSLEHADYDGNGLADKVTESRILADGSRQITEVTFGQGGAKLQTFVTTTSADGLTTQITRGNVEQVITRSAIDPNSYTWSNGVTASTTATNVVVSHQFDALGIETWTMTSKWYVSTTLNTQVSTVRLDAEAKTRVLAEAARIYDTVLDRDMDFAEIEMLVPKVASSQLDELALATELLASSEFATRYGTLTHAEFITQIYLNALGRVPSLAELSENLTSLAAGTITRAKLASGISEGIEHLVVGNSHMSTNNFDVIMNPAVFERSLDEAYVKGIVANLVDVAYDRAATAQELAYLSGLMLKGTDNPDDIATKLLTVRGELQGTGTASLFGLTGAALVEQAFVNALGRQPNAQEQTIWEAHLATGRITVAQFVASLAQSMDHLSAGATSSVISPPAVNAVTGTSAANSLTGTAGQDLIYGLEGVDTIASGDGSDRIVGGGGADLLWGGASTTAASATNGNDIYVWSKGDGNDTINDWGQSMLETDILELLDVASTEVTLSFSSAVGADLLITVVPTGEVIRIDERYQTAGFGYGVEVIRFSDGVSWDLDAIMQRTRFTGDALANTLSGTVFKDNLYGLAGNDTLIAGLGDDQLVGGLGADVLWGGVNGSATAANGNDTFVWSKGDGNDTVNDWGQSLTELDTLHLTDVASTDVALTYSNAAGADLLVTILSTGEVIRIDERNQTISAAYGVERILFGDGVSWSLDQMLAMAKFNGDSAANTLTGSAYRDNVFGLAGNDTLTGNDGDDQLTGGTGTDSLVGGNGQDTYIWSKGDGNDTINDAGVSLLEVDRLRLVDVSSDDVALTRSGNNLTIRVLSTNETLTVLTRFAATTSGAGIEEIVFGDGAVWSLTDILSRTRFEGTGIGETLTGVAYRDNLFGLGGNDTLNGNDGDDLLMGGAGNDSLAGGNGNDLYEWQKGDGNDTINDAGAVAGEVDTLVLKDVPSTGAILARSGANLTVTIAQTGEVLTVQNRFATTGGMAGIEAIEFSDGVVTRVLQDQVALFATTGTAAAEGLVGTIYADSLSGLSGNDTLTGNDGNDILTGGVGVDSLAGGNGSDRYVWAKGDGNDTINDAGASLVETDHLVLVDVSSSDVHLTGANGSANLVIRIVSTGELITVVGRFGATVSGVGIESLSFADGVTWSLTDIIAATTLTGTTAAETLTGTVYRDNISGLAGNDILNAGDGDDVLIGGLGVDSLNGANGNDIYEWSKGDGNDTLNDTGTSLGDVDTLILKDVASTDGLRLTRGALSASPSTEMQLTVESTGEVIRVLGQYANVANGTGVERIQFSDGVSWQLNDILARVSGSGGAAADSLVGTEFRDNLFGMAGNDTLNGGLGDDVLNGGIGNDQLDGAGGNDFFEWYAPDGNDTISDTGTSTYEFDTLRLVGVLPGVVSFFRGSGSNNLRIEIGNGLGGASSIMVMNQFLNPASGVGIEAIAFDDGTLWSRRDILENVSTWGTAGANNLVGSGDNDKIFGRDGNDTLDGGAGNDTLQGDNGADRIIGGAGVDIASYYRFATQGVSVDLRVTTAQIGVVGGTEVGDILSGLEGLEGTAFADTLLGDDQSNWLTGREGADVIYGYDGYDQIRGGIGADTLYGGDGADDIRGDFASDLIYGGQGGDTIDGGDANDLIYGGTGDDFIIAGAGNDTLWGEQGRDTFHFVEGGFGTDAIMGFEDGIDRIWFAPSVAASVDDLSITGNGTTSVTLAVAGGTIVLNSAALLHLTVDDFMFA